MTREHLSVTIPVYVCNEENKTKCLQLILKGQSLIFRRSYQFTVLTSACTHAKNPQSSGTFPVLPEGLTGHSAQFAFILLIKMKYIIFIANIFHAHLLLDLIFQILLLAARARLK